MRSHDARSIVFDGDDTLWMTQSIFKSIIDEFYERLTDLGFSADAAHERFSVINESLLLTINHSTERLGRAMAGTYEYLSQEHGRPTEAGFAGKLIELAQQVYVRMPEPLPGVEAVLAELAEEFELVVYSAGDDTTQRRRLRNLGLDGFFGGRIHVVKQKDDAALRDVMKEVGLRPDETWIVGNSPRFELNPGLRLGLRAVWMHTSFWKLDLEDVVDTKTHVAFSLAETADIIRSGAGADVRYRPIEARAVEFHTQLLTLPGRSHGWVVGTSPRLDLNPAISAGYHTVWIPHHFDSEDVEPIHGRVYVAFSRAAAEQIVRQHASPEWDPAATIFRLRQREGDLGGSLVVD